MSSIAVSSSALQESRAVSRGRFALIGFATISAAVLANVLVYFIGDAVVGYDPDFVVLATIGGTIFFTVICATVAVLLYAVLLRHARNPARTFTIVSAVVLVLSVIPDFTIIPSEVGASNGQTAILVLMHIVAAGVIVWMLTALTRPQSR
jgi:hypothetical protein